MEIIYIFAPNSWYPKETHLPHFTEIPLNAIIKSTRKDIPIEDAQCNIFRAKCYCLAISRIAFFFFVLMHFDYITV